MTQFRPTTAEIDLDALEHNVKAITAALPGAFICPMVKSNAYGHDDAIVAQALQAMGIPQIGVCLLEEALKLRASKITIPILFFLGANADGMKEALRQKITPVLGDWSHVEALEAATTTPVDVHVKFDTGMNRMGFPVKDAARLAERLQSKGIARVTALATHLIQGDDANNDDGVSHRQLRDLQTARAAFPQKDLFLHALNSAGILRKMNSPSATLRSENWGLRPGLMIYGASPMAAAGTALKPVMTLKSQVSLFRNVPRGQTVSYNGTWKAQRDSVIGVIPVGYGDGYHRALSNKADVLFNGKRAPVVGTVCMDYVMIDVTDHVQSTSMEKCDVVLFGKDLLADELAQKAGTISYEIFTSVGARVPRVARGRLAGSLARNGEASL